MSDNNETQDTEQTANPNPSLKNLDRLVGEWHTEISMPIDPPIVTRGRTVVEWLDAGPFIVLRGSVEHPDFPTSTAIVGGDDSTETYSMLYSDSRGVTRIYEMSLSDEVWKLWRDTPGFPQRFTGTLSDDGNTITGSWERSSDGTNWELDFHLTYTKV